MSWLENHIQKNRIRAVFHKRSLILTIFLGLILLFALVLLLPFAVPQPHVAVIRMDGELVAGNVYAGGYVGSEKVGAELRDAATDPDVLAIVLRVNSPGGSPSAAQEIIRDIEYTKQFKPVVISMGDIATSAAYAVSVHGDRIYANPDTITANVGTIWRYYDLSEVYESEGTSVVVVKSGEAKDVGADYRPVSDEELTYLQKMIDDSSNLLLEDVVAMRGVDRSIIEDARVIRGEDAIELGLIDELGNLYDAIDGARDLARTVRS